LRAPPAGLVHSRLDSMASGACENSKPGLPPESPREPGIGVCRGSTGGPNPVRTASRSPISAASVMARDIRTPARYDISYRRRDTTRLPGRHGGRQWPHEGLRSTGATYQGVLPHSRMSWRISGHSPWTKNAATSSLQRRSRSLRSKVAFGVVGVLEDLRRFLAPMARCPAARWSGRLSLLLPEAVPRPHGTQ